MYKRRSWQNFGFLVLVSGATIIGLAIFVGPYSKLQHVIIMFLSGLLIAVAGVAVLIWDWKNRKKYTEGKVDKTLNYVFTLKTELGAETVTDYSQIERALDRLSQTKQGVVEVSIEPPMANICVVDCSYKNGCFYTYFLQERKDGKGYWFSVCETTYQAKWNLKRLYVKHKKIDFNNMKRKETGEGR